jgi:site-specific recombinase XerD
MKAFAETMGYVMLGQWTPIDVREMRTAWSVAPQTAAKNMSPVKAFFEYCVANDWIEKNPARLVKNQRGSDPYADFYGYIVVHQSRANCRPQSKGSLRVG